MIATTRRPVVRRCRDCGCTDDHACRTADGPCWWIAPDRCSACAADAIVRELRRETEGRPEW